ncbi:LexA family transcriptional regulator [Acinetobacter sp. 102]|uniref:LexA family transcriptional regulator n=1 Tax=Acinetobacter sp. 102 TaxID=3098766 RepID=UPI00300A7E92
MGTLQDRFKTAIRHYEESTGKKFVKARLAEYCGVSRPAVSGWIDDNVQTLEQEHAEKAARFLGVNHRWLNGLSQLMLDDGAVDKKDDSLGSKYMPVIAWEAPEDLDPNAYVIIPHVDVKFSAGDGRIVEYDPVQNSKCTAQTWQWIQKKKVSPKHLITVDIDGDSMEPKIPNGSVVTLDKSINTLDQVQSGKVYAIRYGNELKIKRLSKRFDGALIIDSDNPDYNREIVEVDQLEHISIIGKYVSHSYDGEI